MINSPIKLLVPGKLNSYEIQRQRRYTCLTNEASSQSMAQVIAWYYLLDTVQVIAWQFDKGRVSAELNTEGRRGKMKYIEPHDSRVPQER